MKAVIGNLLYDTDASDVILSGRLSEIGLGQLYRTKNGRWFVLRLSPCGADIFPAGQRYVKGELANRPDLYAKYFGQPAFA